mmetsp:Transcript_113015/g.364917  ORF Transcript_113015/g.364917 Transcript_113015/m.364917 type:complete len:285 (-) Transcript_113015:754-1608(-)
MDAVSARGGRAGPRAGRRPHGHQHRGAPDHLLGRRDALHQLRCADLGQGRRGPHRADPREEAAELHGLLLPEPHRHHGQRALAPPARAPAGRLPAQVLLGQDLPHVPRSRQALRRAPRGACQGRRALRRADARVFPPRGAGAAADGPLRHGRGLHGAHQRGHPGRLQRHAAGPQLRQGHVPGDDEQGQRERGLRGRLRRGGAPGQEAGLWPPLQVRGRRRGKAGHEPLRPVRQHDAHPLRGPRHHGAHDDVVHLRDGPAPGAPGEAARGGRRDVREPGRPRHDV